MLRDFRTSANRRGGRSKPRLLLRNARKKSRAPVTSKKTRSGQHWLVWLLGIGLGVSLVGIFIFFWLLPQVLKVSHDQNWLVVPADSDSVVTPTLVRLQLDPPRVWLVALPATAEVAVPGGYGRYPLRAVYPLLELEDRTELYQRAVFTTQLGLFVDEVIPVRTQDITEVTKDQLVAWLGSRENASLTWSELKGWWWLRSLPQAFVHRQQLSDLAGISRQRGWQPLSDGACSIGVVNTTGESGLAARIGQILEDQGFRVIQITSSPVAQPLSKLIVTSRAHTLCEQEINHLTSLSPASQVQVDESIPGQYRADIVINLGSDLATGVRQ